MKSLRTVLLLCTILTFLCCASFAQNAALPPDLVRVMVINTPARCCNPEYVRAALNGVPAMALRSAGLICMW